MGRFLIYLSYVGTCYRGIQIQRQAGKPVERIKTVSGVLEESLRKLKPANEVKVKTSSRTDSNVHALCNTVHVDLIPRDSVNGKAIEFDPHIITSHLNYDLKKSNENISILKTVRVADDFMSRHLAKWRSYVFRLAVIKDLAQYDGYPWTSLELERTQRVYPPFDVDMFLKAAENLSGSHNFLSFTTKDFVRNSTSNPIKNLSICVKKSSAYMEDYQVGSCKGMEFWEVHFRSKSFLYKQVRRMMGAMVDVARGKMTLEKLKYFLDNPSVDNPGVIHSLPGHGLYLKNVYFPNEVLIYEPKKQPEEGLVAEDKDVCPSKTEELSQEKVAVLSSMDANPGVSLDLLHFEKQTPSDMVNLINQAQKSAKETAEAESNPSFGDQQLTVTQDKTTQGAAFGVQGK